MASKLNFNSENLLNVKFDKNMKGYDPEQVDITLDKVILDYRFYENFHKEAKEYINKLESEIKKLRDDNRAKDVEIARIQKRIAGIKDSSKVSTENLDLLQKIDILERALYARGIDPSKLYK